MAQDELTHLDAQGRARMVDVADKAMTPRVAVASARVRMLPATMNVLKSGRAEKGDVFSVARVAGIQAAKRTPELIPLCHRIALSSVEVSFALEDDVVCIEARAKAVDRTGVEMEALTAVGVAALTVYDMLKAIDRGMTIEHVRLEAKSGGASGDYAR